MSDLDSKPASFDVALSLAMFSPDALKRTAYVMMARATMAFEVTNSDVRCTITPTSPAEDVEA